MSLSLEVIEDLKNEWLSELPSGWRFSRFGDVLQIKRRPIEVQDHVEYVQPVIRRGHGGIEVRERQLGVSIKTKAQFLIRAGDWLMSKVQILHRAYGLVPYDLDKAIASGSYYAFEIQKDIDPKYLWYLSHANAFHKSCELASVGVVIEKMVFRATDWLDFQFPLPPLSEQRRIAEILSSVDEAITATRAVIEQTGKVKQGVLEHLLTKGIGHTRFKQTEVGEIPEGWDLKRLRDLAIHITSGSRGWAQYYSDEGDLFLRSQNVRNGSLDLSDKQFVTVPKSAEGSRTLVRADDLVFTITGNSVGNIARIPADLGSAYVSQHVALVRLRDRQLSAFLEAFFSPLGPGNNQILSAQYGQSKPGLSLENVRSFYVPVPPRHELAQLSKIVKDHGVYGMNVAKELSHLISLKAALMSDLLTGRKRVTDALPLAAE
ncbi:restriction endonuclease subunit S [Consotaella salsifontis]|uniref:Type I restriction enzyme, S subunit n=1 Tax=Consotaella salsifontis TaxID=1365950 RepID=A0A1T4RLJ5_9HYPH|nr:restriction endonuclease subunit S [Consotaella salsifontis]SKA16777.1 type I restriction enzyme, S subunit [Consotaella salsifontis]